MYVGCDIGCDGLCVSLWKYLTVKRAFSLSVRYNLEYTVCCCGSTVFLKRRQLLNPLRRLCNKHAQYKVCIAQCKHNVVQRFFFTGYLHMARFFVLYHKLFRLSNTTLRNIDWQWKCQQKLWLLRCTNSTIMVNWTSFYYLFMSRLVVDQCSAMKHYLLLKLYLQQSTKPPENSYL